MENQMNAVSLDATKENSIDAEPARPLTRLDEAAALLEQRQPEQTLEWAFNEFGASVTLATGFGVEGVALIDMAAKRNLRIDVFFLDTSFLFPETYALRRGWEDRYGMPIRSYQTALRRSSRTSASDPGSGQPILISAAA